METTPFKPGDVVVCIDDSTVETLLTVGDKYTVIESREVYTTVRTSDSKDNSFYSHRFELFNSNDYNIF